jgi:hypothetical protein
LAIVAIAFATHAVLAIAVAYYHPAAAAACMPGAESYWQRQQTWITRGEDPEYQVAHWLPAQAQLLVAMIALAATSLGAIPFAEGFYQVDLMNFYNGRLLSISLDPWLAAALGWHSWSIARGICYALLVFEVSSASLAWWIGTACSTPARRAWRWAGALSCFMGDVLLKLALLEPVRAGLANNIVR